MRYDRDGGAEIAYGMHKADLSVRAGLKSFEKGRPVEILLENLKPDSRYYYEVRDLAEGSVLVEGSFRTRRPPGAAFTFTVTADSHLDQNTDPVLYRRTLKAAAEDMPDFHIDLGDTFMTDKHESRENAAQQYRAQRFHFGELGRTVPVFLVLGNHDGEDAKLRRGGADSLALWSNAMRKRYFPNPVPDKSYSGNATRVPNAGLLQDYYAWHWGDALFVVLSPYWHAAGRKGDERWDLSLGEEQYKWLGKTLETSRAKHKLVFVHQLVGGLDTQGRGGAEAAVFGEWGGRNADGSEGFRQHRPGWEAPIHHLLVRNHVSMVLHGHDHLFARQDLDGIVYQEVPQPGHQGAGSARSAAEYGYRDGVILGGSGYMRVAVSPDKLKVDFFSVHASESSNMRDRNRQPLYSYTIDVPGKTQDRP